MRESTRHYLTSCLRTNVPIAYKIKLNKINPISGSNDFLLTFIIAISTIILHKGIGFLISEQTKEEKCNGDTVWV